MVQTGHAGPTGHYWYWCSQDQSSHFSGSYAMITQRFENYQRSVFGFWYLACLLDALHANFGDQVLTTHMILCLLMLF